VALQTTRQIEHWTRKHREACALRNPYVRFEERYHWPPKKSSDLDESQVVLAVAVEIKKSDEEGEAEERQNWLRC